MFSKKKNSREGFPNSFRHSLLTPSHYSYQFDFAEFHFGPTDTAGSEHTIDGASSPMEMYLVYHDTAALDLVAGAVRDSFFTDAIDIALAAPDAARVAAISVHFEVGNTSQYRPPDSRELWG